MTAYGPIYKCIKRFISVICAPRAHDKSKVRGHVPHGVGAYANKILQFLILEVLGWPV